MNVLTSVMAIPAIYVYVIHSINYFEAQFCVFLMWSLGSLIAAVGVAISCFQIGYVTNFSSSFSWIPERVGMLTLTVLAICCVLPHLVIILHSSLKEEHATQATAFFSGQSYRSSSGIPLITMPAVVLALICIVMLAVSYVIIPSYLKCFRTVSNHNEDLTLGNARFNVKRLLFVIFSCGIALVVLITLKIKSDDDKVPVQGHVFTFVMNFILFLLVVDHDELTPMSHLWVDLAASPLL